MQKWRGYNQWTSKECFVSITLEHNVEKVKGKKPIWTSNKLFSILNATWWQVKARPCLSSFLVYLLATFFWKISVSVNRFYHLDRMRQRDTLSGLEKLHSISYTFSIRNHVDLSGILTVQALCVFSYDSGPYRASTCKLNRIFCWTRQITIAAFDIQWYGNGGPVFYNLA